MRRPLIAPLLLVLASIAEAGPLEDARYLQWTQQPEAAAAVLEPWLAEHPDDLVAHHVYLETRVLGMGEAQVVRAEYEAWTAPSPEIRTAALDALSRVERGEQADPEANPFPSQLNKRWVKYLSRQWQDDPVQLRTVAPILWGLDAPIGNDADELRTFALKLASEGATSDDPMWVEASRAVAERGDVPGLAVVALQKLAELDPKAWPGALDDTAMRKVRKAARAVSPQVALKQLDKVKLTGTAPEAEQLRHTLRSELLAEMGRDKDALEALYKAWQADSDDAEAAAHYALAQIDAGTDLEQAGKAIRAGLDAATARVWTEASARNGLLWPEAYTLFYADRRVAIGRLEALRKRLAKLTRTSSPAAEQPGPSADAAHHLAAGVDREDRVGTRHLVQAIRLARAAGDKATETAATKALEARKTWFAGGVDARIEGWNKALGAPGELRPMPGPRSAPPVAGQPLTDFQVTLDGKKVRLSEVEGFRVLATFTPDCTECAGFLRNLDAVSREIQAEATRYLAIEISGDGRSLDKLLEGSDLAVEVARTDGQLPNDFTAGGVPRVFVVGPKGQVLRDTDRNPDIQAIRLAIRDGLADVSMLIEVGDAPPSVRQMRPQYPLSAHWLGTPEADCLGQVILTPEGVPFHVNPEDCEEPFVSVTRAALSEWRFAPRNGMAEALVTVGFKEPFIKYPGLPEASCLWWGRAQSDGTLYDTFTNCARGQVHPSPVPWSEVGRTDQHTVSTAAGNMVIHNVDLPVACEVAVDVGPKAASLAPDQGECPEVVRNDTLERVRRWDWDVGMGRNPPIRVVVRYDPPKE